MTKDLLHLSCIFLCKKSIKSFFEKKLELNACQIKQHENIKIFFKHPTAFGCAMKFYLSFFVFNVGWNLKQNFKIKFKFFKIKIDFHIFLKIFFLRSPVFAGPVSNLIIVDWSWEGKKKYGAYYFIFPLSLSQSPR